MIQNRPKASRSIFYILVENPKVCKRLRNRLLKRGRSKILPTNLIPPKAKYDRDESYDFAAQVFEVYGASECGDNRRTIVKQSGRCRKHPLFLARAMAVIGYLRQLA